MTGCEKQQTHQHGAEDTWSDEDVDDKPLKHPLYKPQPPPQHYYSEAQNLDISDLRRDRYSDNTKLKHVSALDLLSRYCKPMGIDPEERLKTLGSNDETVQFLYGFFKWRGELEFTEDHTRRVPGVKAESTIRCLWKDISTQYRRATRSELDEFTRESIIDMIVRVAKELGLRRRRKPRNNMHVETFTMMANTMLSTTRMTFKSGWERIQTLLFCQLAAVTVQRPTAVRFLRYRDMELKLLPPAENAQDKHPRLLMSLSCEFCKDYLETKEGVTVMIPEIIFDPSLILSPHVFFLGMVFYLQAFGIEPVTGQYLDSPETLYNMEIPKGCGSLKLPFKEELADNFVFCDFERDSNGHWQPDTATRMPKGKPNYRIRETGMILGLDQACYPYLMRYAGAKNLNRSPEVTDSLQNLILQHHSIDVFVKHYQVGVEVDLQAIFRGTASQTQLLRYGCSMEASIDPDRPTKLTPEERDHVDSDPEICRLMKHREKARKCYEERKKKRYAVEAQGTDSQKFKVYQEREERALKAWNDATRFLRNERQRLRKKRLEVVREKWNKEQPLRDIAQQKLLSAGEPANIDGRSPSPPQCSIMDMPPQHRKVIEAVLSMPKATVEEEYRRRIDAINVITKFCGVQDGRPTPQGFEMRATCERPQLDSNPLKRERTPEDASEQQLPCEREGSPKRQKPSPEEQHLVDAMKDIYTSSPGQRTIICFVCMGENDLSIRNRTKKYATPGALAKHFLTKHANRPESRTGYLCKRKSME
ncbi:uncharacterized protein BDV14DRAFT_140260 [Aspergillus stella-maris]|uniref:uncharacterized protein n=1 Tax=Aspergillus stella-maris TaxID=1810926 RepID=UPI003CCDB3D1